MEAVEQGGGIVDPAGGADVDAAALQQVQLVGEDFRCDLRVGLVDCCGGAVAAFEDHRPIPPGRQKPGCGQAGEAAADDGDALDPCLCRGRHGRGSGGTFGIDGV